MPSRMTAARLWSGEVSRLPVKRSHSTWTTVDWRLLLPPKNSCTCSVRHEGPVKGGWVVLVMHQSAIVKHEDWTIKETKSCTTIVEREQLICII